MDAAPESGGARDGHQVVSGKSDRSGQFAVPSQRYGEDEDPPANSSQAALARRDMKGRRAGRQPRDSLPHADLASWFANGAWVNGERMGPWRRRDFAATAIGHIRF